jgi:SAM-dependent methyltransferase
VPSRFGPFSQHALLHRGGPAGTWGNLGLWDSAQHYAEACRALALHVGTAAGIRAGDRVLDLACGRGDELLLWAGHFGASHVTGIEVDLASANCARAHCEETRPEKFTVLTRSALDLHDLPAGAYDRVLCIDAAYHLTPRTAFLAAARHCLRPGGTLAYTDLTLARRPGWPLRAAARACGLDADDLFTLDAQVARLAGAGFSAIAVEALDARVLAGFSAFALRQTRRLGFDALRRGWRRPLATALMIRALGDGALGYGLLRAQRPSS